MPPSADPLLVRRLSPRVVGELGLGLLLGVAVGWLAGLVRVRRP